MDKPHGNAGNQYAKKYSTDERNAYLHIGCAQSDKNRWVSQAQAEGKKLGVWVIEKLNKP
jgi:hypothetical protein